MMHSRFHAATESTRWRGFVAGWLGGVLALGLAAVGVVAVLDPYGLRAAPGRAPGPLMDLNQRFMYPQVVRTHRYDAAVFGTSTARLLDPSDLDRAFDARFANLAMNAATPYEQVQLATLFLRETTARAVLLALDATWCDADADARRLTFRPFPPWLYRPGTPGGTLRQVNWQSLGVAARVALNGLGLAPARIRGDGFSVFTPPEDRYDAARASAHIRAGLTALDEPDPGPATAAEDAPGDPMPALAWLDDLLARTPASATKLVAFMPVHAVLQGRPGTVRGAREAACKVRVAAIGRARGAVVVDFRIPSPVTTRDANYWDALHYRLPIAARIVAGLRAAQDDGRDDPEGVYRVLTHP